MTTVFLIDIEDFKRRADLSQNLNTNKLKAEIGLTQEKYGVKILCQKLYDEILSQFPNDLSTTNAALLIFLQDFLIYKTYNRYLDAANIFASPAGIRTQTDTTSTVASDPQMKVLSRRSLSDANFFQDKLVNFLICNEDDYPLWTDSICNCLRSIRPINQNRFTNVGTKGKQTPIRWT